MGDILFLDANVLFSAAYRADSGLRRFWKLEEASLITSSYAAHEARRNLEDSDRLERLEELLFGVTIVPESSKISADAALPADVTLPPKDEPILRAAVGSGATHLVTGDRTHFGPLFDREISGVRVVRPATYLRAVEP